MKWLEIEIKTTHEAVELVTDILYDAGVSGVVIEDPKDIISNMKTETDWDYYEESLLEIDYDGAIVKGYLPEGDELFDKIKLIKENVSHIKNHDIDSKTAGEITITEVFEEDWANSWKKYYKPQKISATVVVKPTWEEYSPEENDKVIELDPGMAFGTGTHETTKMCVQLIEEYLHEDSIVFDIGCGSGILSIASAKLGAQKVIGVDLDEVAYKVSKENVQINHVDDIVTIVHGNLMDVIKEKADIIVANIIAEIIIILARDIHKFMHHDSKFIASGIILDKVNTVVKELENYGLKIIHIDRQGEWAAIVSELDKDGYHE